MEPAMPEVESATSSESCCGQLSAQSKPPLRVYVCGAHSTGKTTLVNDLAPYLTLHVEKEVARGIIRDLGWETSFFHPSTRPDNFEKLNSLILDRQCSLDRQHTQNGTGFLSDRGVDPLIYMQQYVSRDALQRLLRQPGADQWLTSLRADSCLVFVVEPFPECIVDDHVRLPPHLTELKSFTSAMTEFLTSHSIPYHVISVLDRQQRVSYVLDIIRKKHPDVLRTSMAECSVTDK